MTEPRRATDSNWKYVHGLASAVLELADRLAAMEAAATPSPTAEDSSVVASDHSRGATEMVATDEELWAIWANRPRGPLSAVDALRTIYNLGRQHGTQPRHEGDPTPPPPPAGGLVESVIEEICHITSNRPAEYVTRGIIRAIADWLDTRGDCGSAEALRREAD